MRHLQLLLLAALLSISTLFAQKGVCVHPNQMVPTTMDGATPLMQQAPQREKPQPMGNARITTVSPTLIGSSPNIFTSTVPMANCVHANDSSGAITFIHRNNTSIFGGSGTGLRYDISTDHGNTWSSDIGPVNPTNLNGRFPQIAGYDPIGNTSALNGRAIYLADYNPGVGWQGFNYGTTELVTSGVPATQDVILTTGNQYGSGAMVQGHKGEYWTARFSSSSGYIGDSLKVYKGVYNTGSQTMVWSLNSVKMMPWSLSFDGHSHAVSPSIAFSPDGNTGWIATLGDLTMGGDSTLSPILIKSTDAGATWGSPVEVSLNSFPWVYDSLRSLWVDTLGNPASSGRATSGFHYDLTVDAAGNPHMFFVMGTASDANNAPSYSIFSGLSKYAVDLTSSNQGNSFDLRLVAPVLTFRSPTYGATSTTMNQDNYPQVSRTQDGNYIFFSWIDTDTALYTGSQLGIGFGQSTNQQPNLWIAGLRIADGYSTCIHPVTQGDLIWEGFMFCTQMAPEVITIGTGPSTAYRLPIVSSRMPSGEPANPVDHYYFGADATISESEFIYPPGSSIAWTGCALSSATAAHLTGKVYADNNSNGVFDGPDAPIPFRVVRTTGFIYADLTDANGNFDILVLPNSTYGLVTAPLNAGAWTATIPSSAYSITSPGSGAVLAGNDFAFTPIPNAEDLSVQSYFGPMRSGFTSSGAFYLQNLGTIPSTGTLTFNYDPLSTLVSAVPPPTTNNTSTHQATWNLGSIPSFGTMQVLVDLSIPVGTPLGTWLTLESNVATAGTDVFLSNNNSVDHPPVIGSFDPNDKNSMPAGVGPNHQVDPNTPLTYRIRFQNTGNASAIDVEIRDILEAGLDIGTFNPLGASHNYSLSITDGHVLDWDFSNINLPDSFSNEPASHGYIDFSIAPVAGLPLGTVVENRAAIYFDFNPPVITEPTWVTYDISSAVTNGSSETSVRIYPHPVSNHACVELQHYNGEEWTFELLDLQGRRVRQEVGLRTGILNFDRKGLPAGTYLYKVTQAESFPQVGKIILQ